MQGGVITAGQMELDDQVLEVVTSPLSGHQQNHTCCASPRNEAGGGGGGLPSARAGSQAGTQATQAGPSGSGHVWPAGLASPPA